MSPPTRSGGFTLVEVLVALAVMALMAIMAWQGVDGIVHARDGSQGRLDKTLRLDSVVMQWEQDLGALQESSAVPALSCDGSTVRLTRRAEGGLQVVAWSMRPDVATSTWWRWASPAVTTVGDLQENWIRSQQLQDGDPAMLRTIDGLNGWQVYFYRGNGWSNCQSTGDVTTTTTVTAPAPATSAAPGGGSPANGTGGTPPPANATAGGTGGAAPVTSTRIALPSGVRIVLDFGPGSGRDGSLTRDVLIGP
jgi:general secretion pathway protein J